MIDISKITEYLYVGAKIGHEHADELKVMKFDLIISMIGQVPLEEIYTLPPFKCMRIRAIDSCWTPIAISKLTTGVEAALPVIKAGGKVLVFCMQGRRRSVTMAAAILIAMGHTSDEATQLLMAGREIADPRRWYVRHRIKLFEKCWRGYENQKPAHHH
jgi:protein-tyrosine phosphatase